MGEGGRRKGRRIGGGAGERERRDGGRRGWGAVVAGRGEKGKIPGHFPIVKWRMGMYFTHGILILSMKTC